MPTLYCMKVVLKSLFLLANVVLTNLASPWLPRSRFHYQCEWNRQHFLKQKKSISAGRRKQKCKTLFKWAHSNVLLGVFFSMSNSNHNFFAFCYIFTTKDKSCSCSGVKVVVLTATLSITLGQEVKKYNIQ